MPHQDLIDAVLSRDLAEPAVRTPIRKRQYGNDYGALQGTANLMVAAVTAGWMNLGARWLDPGAP